MVSKIIQEHEMIIRELEFGKKDLIGVKIGESGKVLGYAGNNRWYVKCSCGKIFDTHRQCIIGNKSVKAIQSCYECSVYRNRDRCSKNVIGKKYNKLEIISVFYEGSVSYCFCHCDCGNFCVSTREAVTCSYTKSCGCIKHNRPERWIDIRGQRFGRLVVKERVGRNKRCESLYECDCDCGKTCRTTLTSLKSNKKNSCGCLKKEHSLKNLQYLNSFQKGKLHPCFNPNITEEERINGRRYYSKSNLRELTFERDKYTCLRCNKVGGKINAHHVQNWKNNPELRFEISNLCVLCKSCHDEFHGKYGREFTNQEQLEEFIGKSWNPANIELIKVIIEGWPVFCLAYDPIYLGM